jgi:hypothetical protein
LHRSGNFNFGISRNSAADTWKIKMWGRSLPRVSIYVYEYSVFAINELDVLAP